MIYRNINRPSTLPGPGGVGNGKTANTHDISISESPNKHTLLNDKEINKNKNIKPQTKIDSYIYNQTIQIATYNVRTLAEKGRFEEVCMMANDNKLDIILIQEHRYTTEKDIDYFNSSKYDYFFVYGSAIQSNRNKIGGVGIIIKKSLKENIKKYVKVSDRIIAVHFNTNPEFVIINVYAPTESSKTQLKQKFYEDLEKYTSTNKYSVTITGGDFNAQLGKDSHEIYPHIVERYAYHEKTNNNGKKLIEFCENNQFRPTNTRFPKKLNKLWTYQLMRVINKKDTKEHSDKFQIDHFLINSRWISSIKDCEAHETGGIYTDHRVLTIKFKLTFKLKETKQQQNKVPNLEKLKKDKELQKSFQNNISNHLNSTNHKNHNNSIQEQFDNLSVAINKSRKTLPVKEEQKKNWMSTESIQIKRERDQAIIEFTKNKTKENRKKMKKLNKKLKNSYKKDKESYFEAICKEITDADAAQNTSKVYEKVRSLSGNFNKKVLQLKNKDGELTADTKIMLHIYKEYFSDLLNVTNINILNDMEPPEILPINTEKFTLKELNEVIRYLKSNKAPGIDQIRNEEIKYGGLACKKEILDICNKIYETNEAPWQMTTNKIIPIYKKGDPAEPSNYRGISLLSTITKIYNKLLLDRIYDKVNEKLAQSQRGFRRNSSTIQAINTLRRILEGHYKKDIPIVLTFVDFSKAFDSINREAMWKILAYYGIPDKIIKAIKTMYNNSYSRISYNGQLSEKFKINSGILQGDALSPFLFITVLDFALKRIPNGFGIQTHANPTKTIKHIEYADDTVLTDVSPEQAIEHLKQMENAIKVIGLSINKSKTCFMTNITDKTKTDPLSAIIVKTDKCKYLGSYINSAATDIMHRRALAFNTFWKMKNIWNDRYASLKIKLKIFDVTCISIFLYGSETWTLNTELENKINSFATICYRAILKISKFQKISNDAIYDRVERRPLIEKVRERQINFIKNTLNLNNDDLIKTYLIYVPKTGVKKRGRTPKLFDKYATILLGDQAHLLNGLLVN